MKNQHLLVGVAWVASVVGAYFAGDFGRTGPISQSEGGQAAHSEGSAGTGRELVPKMAEAPAENPAEVRTQAVSAVFGTWHAKAAAAAAAALQDSGLSAEKIRELKAQPPKPEPKSNYLHFFFSANFQSGATTALAGPAAVLQPARPSDAFLRTACWSVRHPPSIHDE